MNLVEKHNLSYINRDDSGHTLKCTICDYESEVVSHTLYLDNGTYKCQYCNYEKTHVCEYVYAENDTETHKHYCKVCGKIDKSEPHTFEYRTTHERYCTVCGYVILSEKEHTKQYTKVDGNSHKITCKVCGYLIKEKEAHTFEYSKPKTGNSHQKRCKYCDLGIITESCTNNGNKISNYGTTCDVCGLKGNTSRVTWEEKKN